jgi:hypothetical protein
LYDVSECLDSMYDISNCFSLITARFLYLILRYICNVKGFRHICNVKGLTIVSLLLYCCFTAALLLLLYCCFTSAACRLIAALLLLLYCCFTTALLRPPLRRSLSAACRLSRSRTRYASPAAHAVVKQQ